MFQIGNSWKIILKSLHHKPLTTKNTVGNGLALNVDEWKEFTLDDVFVERWFL